MSTLLEQASLVMIPSGYKEDVVYSAVPTDGSGDLSFTRASNGTRVNSAGLVEVCPWNLVEQSETFDNATWQKSGINVTANAVANPLTGLANADNLVADSGNNFHYIYQPITYTTDQYTIFVYLKANGYSWFVIDAGLSNRFAYFNTTTGVVGTTGSSSTATIESVGNGWYKCSLSYTGIASSTGIYLSVRNADNGGAFTGNGTGGILAYGAQVNLGTAKPYFPTTDRLNVPRLTYQNGGGGCPSLLLEKQSTNYARNNNDLSGWTKITGTDTISLNAGTSPDGTANGINLIPSTANGTHMFYDNSTSVASSGNFTMTCYAKANGYSKFSMRESASVGYYASFNLSNGTVIDNGGNTASIENLGNGWYRCICSVVASTSVQIGLLILSDSYTSGQPFGQTWSGDGTKGILTYGAQLEVSTSYATSLISTTGVASATRVADACFKTGISSLIGQTEGVLFCDFNWQQKEGVFFINSISDGTINNEILMAFGSSADNRIRFSIASGGVESVNQDSAVLSSGRYKIAFAYASNDAAVYINGTQLFTDSSVVVPTTSAFKFLRANDTLGFDGQINEQLLFKTRLTNAELASLTTL